jgi:drug/metabolite transporter (DMT)-like permease
MITIILGLTAAFAYSLYGFGSQRLVRGTSWKTLVAAMFATGFVVLVVPALFVDGLPLGRDELHDVALAALGGLLYTAATVSFLLALRVGKLSLVTVLACLDGAFAAIISVAMGERPGALAAAGLVFAAAGGLLAAVERGREQGGGGGRRRWRLAAGAGLALVTSLAMAGVFIAYGAIDAFSPLTTVTVASAAGLAVMVPIAAAGRVLLPPRDRAAGVIGVSLLDMLGFLAGSAALAVGPVSVASVLQAQTATLSTVLGVMLLRERPAWWQSIGIVATIAGVSMLAWAM